MSHNISYKQQLTQEIWDFLPFLAGEKLSENVPLAKYGANSLDVVDMLIKMEEKHNPIERIRKKLAKPNMPNPTKLVRNENRTGLISCLFVAFIWKME